MFIYIIKPKDPQSWLDQPILVIIAKNIEECLEYYKKDQSCGVDENYEIIEQFRLVETTEEGIVWGNAICNLRY